MAAERKKLPEEQLGSLKIWILFILQCWAFAGGVCGLTNERSTALGPSSGAADTAGSRLLGRIISHALAIRRLGRKSVCYDHLGCFHVSGRFSHFRRVPDPPDSLGTRFLLCTRRDPECDDGSTLMAFEPGNSVRGAAAARLDVHLPTKVIIHGYSGRPDYPKVTRAKNAFLKKEDCNVIIVDWEVAARGPTYLRAVANAELVGRQIAKLLEALVAYGASPRDFHIIGFSLGAQIAGFAGEGLKEQNLKLGRITGLDPASFLFERTNLDTARKLDSSDAELVDVIHTDGSLIWADGFGVLRPLGHVDFFVNGGQNQPGCFDTYVDVLAFRLDQRPNTTRSCSHGRSLDIFIESMQSTECQFVGFPCPGLKDFERNFVHGNCFSCDSGSCAILGRNPPGHFPPQSASPGDQGGAGGWTGGPGRGPLFLVTRETKPYCGQQVRVLVFLSPRTQSIRGDLQLTLLHANASTIFDLNAKIYPLSHTMETLHGGRGASSVVALKSGSLSPEKTPTLRAQVLFKPAPGMSRLGPRHLFIDKVTVTSQEGQSWYFCGKDTLLEEKEGATYGEVDLQLDMITC